MKWQFVRIAGTVINLATVTSVTWRDNEVERNLVVDFGLDDAGLLFRGEEATKLYDFFFVMLPGIGESFNLDQHKITHSPANTDAEGKEADNHAPF